MSTRHAAASLRPQVLKSDADNLFSLVHESKKSKIEQRNEDVQLSFVYLHLIC